MTQELVLVLGLPIITAYIWLTIWLFRFSRREKYRKFQLPKVFTIKCALATVVAAYQTWSAYSRIDGPLPDFTIVINIIAAVVLLIIPSMSVVYLIWLDRKRNGHDRRGAL